MTNLTNPTTIWLKGGLFVSLGLLASGLLLARLPDLRSAALLAIAIWAFCRAYYFAFYVIEHYVDPNYVIEHYVDPKYRFAGLLHFARYAILGHSPDEPDGGQPCDE